MLGGCFRLRGHLRQAVAVRSAPLRGALRYSLPRQVPPPSQQAVRLRLHLQDPPLLRDLQVMPSHVWMLVFRNFMHVMAKLRSSIYLSIWAGTDGGSHHSVRFSACFPNVVGGASSREGDPWGNHSPLWGRWGAC